MCPTCHRPLSYAQRHRGARYCCRAHWRQRPQLRKLTQAHDLADVLQALNSGRPLEVVASDLGVSRAHLYAWMHEARIARVGGRGQYAVVHWRNARQLALF